MPRIPEVSDCPQFAVSTNDDCISFLDINKNHHGDQIKVTFRFKVRVPQSKLPIQTCFSKFNGGWLFSGSENTNLIAIKIPDKTTKKETEPIEIKHHTAPVLTVAVNTRVSNFKPISNIIYINMNNNANERCCSYSLNYFIFPNKSLRQLYNWSNFYLGHSIGFS